MRICDICGKREGTLVDHAVKNNVKVEYAYCEACYRSLLKNGVNPQIEVDRIRKFNSKECVFCGTDVQEFENSFLFGCPSCYANMRAYALDVSSEVQGATRHIGKRCIPFDLNRRGATSKTLYRDLPSFATDGNYIDRILGGDFYGGKKRFKTADECSAKELTEPLVISSRIRLARNVKGLVFPRKMQPYCHNVEDEILGAYLASLGVFDARVRRICDLDKSQKKVLIERHVISLNLANNEENGAVIVDGGDTGFSVMINEEDHVREQCVVDGFNLKTAYKRLNVYDDNLMRNLPIAYDDELGFLTACPTNVGTGMRASVMVFLPALRRAGAIDDALDKFKKAYGLTIRGIFGEGSEAQNDVYQISNSRTLGVDERTTIAQVEEAVENMCYFERVALEKLVSDEGESFLDEITRSYNFLFNAGRLEFDEFASAVSNLKLGVILGVLPTKLKISQIDKLELLCSPASIEIAIKNRREHPSDLRAEIVRAVLTEGRC
ncbi:MAG: hypothetical protein IK048_01470 [Clostridia bacterium]|nr:hypothetical protein [Clostridia bacterium]